jgi:hypothetical protein
MIPRIMAMQDNLTADSKIARELLVVFAREHA